MRRSTTRSSDKASNDRLSIRSFHHSAYTPARVAAARAELELGVSVCLPARECAGTVGAIVASLRRLKQAGAIDAIVVVDAASADGTAALAEREGAVVLQEAELMPSYGPVLGKGDAMWRALSVLEGELVCFVDADTESFSEHFVTGLLGPLVCEPGVSFVKGFYRRPFACDRASEARAIEAGVPGRGYGGGEDEEGGRVNHLMARPALELFYPQLAQVRQPLAGEVAVRREMLERLPFATGYGVEIAMLIDAWREVGLGGIAQVDLEEHRNRHQPLSALTPMALTVLATIARRLEREGRLSEAGAGGAAGNGGASPRAYGGASAHAPVERPPFAIARAA